MAKFTPKFWKPGTEAPGAGINEERGAEKETQQNFSALSNPYKSLSIEQQRQRLPIFQYRNHILYLLEKYKTLVLVGETGSGKSTQIPQYLLEAGWAGHGFSVAVTQPRRVAAVTVAQRVSDERGAILGHEVGYAIRFEDCSDPIATRIKFMTDGYLIREMMRDPLLQHYSVVMLDEAHERTLYTDIAMGLLKKIQKKRPELKIVIASATLDAEKFMQYFNQNVTDDENKNTSAIITVEGRSYPVDIFYTTSPVPNYLDATIDAVKKIHKKEPMGDVLAFLTGQEEVQQACRSLIDFARELPSGSNKLMVLPMYSNLPILDQVKVFERTGKNTRKVVVATNIAETSITINGIGYVIDCGFVKMRVFHSKTGMDSLVTVPVSQAASEQRAGRAGRVRSGKAYRLFTEEQFEKLPSATVPEIQRSNLGTAILQLKCLGIDNVLRFNFPSPPSSNAMVRGVELLYALGALDEYGKLTEPVGVQMAELPLDPRLAKMLLASGEFGCSEEIATISALLQVKNIFLAPPNQRIAANNAKKKFSVTEGDHITLLNVFEAFKNVSNKSRWCQENFLNYKGLTRAVTIRKQLLKLMKKFKIPLASSEGDVDIVCRCIVAGFFTNAAWYHSSGCYKTIRENMSLHMHPTSVLCTKNFPHWVIYHELLTTGKDYMRDITAIKPEWLYELAPHYYQFGTDSEIATKRMKTAEAAPT